MTWVFIAALAVIAIAAISWPLLRKPPASATRAAYDLTIFEDQMKEVDRDVERGVLTPEQADAARAEIQRRISAAEKAPDEVVVTDSNTKRNWVIAAVVVAIPLVAGGIYWKVGTPDPAKTTANDIDKMVEQLAAKVAQDPNDIEGVQLLARTYSRIGRFADAVKTYQQVLALEPDAANFSSYGEAMVFAGQGVVNKEAHDAFVRGLSLDRSEPRARFYLGLEQVDKSQPNNALAIWRDLADNAPADAPWLDMVKEQMANVAKDANIPPMTVQPKHPLEFVPPEELALARVQASAPPTAVAKRPAPAAPGQMAPETQAKIQEMVAGLAKRLEGNPNDYDGWLMLGRSYTVLKNFDGAKTAYDKAGALKPDSVDPKLQYMAALMTTVDPEAPAALPQNVTDAAIAVLKVNPKQPEALYVSGLARAKVGDKGGARTLWTQAKDAMPPDSPLRGDLERRLEALDQPAQ